MTDMADEPASTPKIDSLRAKVNADPKSRHFYPLAEELRKIGQAEEAEKVLRAGLEHHTTYLSAWISLGRVLRERGANQEAVDRVETRRLRLELRQLHPSKCQLLHFDFGQAAPRWVRRIALPS